MGKLNKARLDNFTTPLIHASAVVKPRAESESLQLLEEVVGRKKPTLNMQEEGSIKQWPEIQANYKTQQVYIYDKLMVIRK